MSVDRLVGTVLEGTGGIWKVASDSGETRRASLRGRLKLERNDSLKLAVGDRVALAADDDGQSWTITEILPRKSKLARRSPAGAKGERVIAANVDQVVIVFSAARPEPHRRMIDRFLVIAEANSLAARLVINKIDLVDAVATRAQFADYERAGYPVHQASVKKDVGIRELHDALAGRTSVLTGPSGVGKSSLINSMYPGLNLRVGEVSESVNKGRHTTVGALLHPLPDGGYVVDSPGLREVGMWGLDPEHLDACFPELAGAAPECRFADCTHRQEPGCAISSAVESGSISRERYDSYVKLREEMEEEERRSPDYTASMRSKKKS